MLNEEILEGLLEKTQKKRGAPRGNKNAKKKYRAKRQTIRLYPEDNRYIEDLLRAGFGQSKNDVIRQCIREIWRKYQEDGKEPD